MLSWSATLLGVQRGTFVKFARSALASRHYCKDVPPGDASPPTEDDSEPKTYTVDDFADHIKSEEDEKKIHLILLEISSLRDDFGQAPSEIKPRDITDLLGLSMWQRRKYYHFMWKREIMNQSRKKKYAIRRELRDKMLQERREQNTEIPPGLFPFIRKPQMFNMLWGRRLMEAALFGQKLVFDLGYESHMMNRETRNLGEQLQLAYAANKVHPHPFDLTCCNVEEGSFMDQVINNCFAGFSPGRTLIEKTNKHYLDLFPRDKLVYLSPDARTPMKQWDHSAIYIIGGIVDLGSEKPLSLAKAKEEGIPCARFPIQEHIALKTGSQKTLTLNTVTEILLSMKTNNDWGLALKKMPSRFVLRMGESASAERSRLRNIERMKSFSGKHRSASLEKRLRNGGTF